MIVGTRDIDRAGLRRACSSSESLIRYSDGLVPKFMTHIQPILENQRYLTAIIVRSLQGIPYVTKSKLVNALLDGVVVRGNISTIIAVEDLLTEIDLDKVFKELFREELV